MTPKSLLRHPRAASRSGDLARGQFEPVLDDDTAAQHPSRVRRVVLCSGHVWAELESQAEDVAVIRLEQLYPFPQDALEKILDKYHRVEQTIWLQEEPQNMGAWNYVERQLRGRLELRYVGRHPSASPAEGWAETHKTEQRRVVSEAFAHEGLTGVTADAR
jgi:2-oxoglutarate dehydrogenase E1 component